MGLFFSTYRVEHKEGMLFSNWVTVLSNVSQKEAERYIKEKTGGLFSESSANYRIVIE